MKSETPTRLHSFWGRTALFLTGVLLLGIVYIFQRFNPWSGFDSMHPNAIFAINRIFRLILNDLACFLIIFAIFQEAKYLKIAFWVFLFELVVILPMYLVIKLSLEGDSEISSPLLSQVHRLIVNPMLMFLLIAGFFYQRYIKK